MNANAGFHGSYSDEDMLAGGLVSSTQPHVTDDDEGDDNPCIEDEDFFQGRPDADAMDETITKFLDGMEGQERGGFKDLHRFLVLRREINQCCTLRLWRAASLQVWMLRNRKDSHHWNYCYTGTHWNTGTLLIHCTYIVHTRAFLFILSTYIVHTQAFQFILGSY